MEGLEGLHTLLGLSKRQTENSNITEHLSKFKWKAVPFCSGGPLKHEVRSKQQCEEVWATWGDVQLSSGDLTLSEATAPSSVWKTLEAEGNMDAQGT